MPISAAKSELLKIIIVLSSRLMKPTLLANKNSKRSRESLSDIFRRRITNNYWKPDERLPTEKELAEEFGVCAATIQRHLKDLQREGLIYGKRGQGRFVTSSARRPSTGNVGVMLHDSRHLAHPRMAQIIAGIGTALAEANRHLSIFAINQLASDNAETSMPLLSSCGKNGILSIPALQMVDGIILLTQQVEPATVQQLAEFFPIVLAHEMNIPNVITVADDSTAGSLMALNHLTTLGHKRIAVITKGPEDPVARLIRDGVRLATQMHSPSPEIRIYTQKIFNDAEGFRIAEEIVSEKKRSTAIVCEDQTAQGVLQFLEKKGLRLPEDMSLVSWNATLTERKPVGITSICFDDFDAGVRRARRLLESIESRTVPFEKEYIEPHLEIRQSTAAPPKV